MRRIMFGCLSLIVKYGTDNVCNVVLSSISRRTGGSSCASLSAFAAPVDGIKPRKPNIGNPHKVGPPLTVITIELPTINAAVTRPTVIRLAARSTCRPNLSNLVMSTCTCNPPRRVVRSKRRMSCGILVMMSKTLPTLRRPRFAIASGV